MVKLENLTFGYTKKAVLFNDLSMSLEAGRIYGLFGMNGAGKTTLLKQIAGLLFPLKGKCLIFNEHSCDRKPSALSDIFLIPEEFVLPNISSKAFIKINSPFFPKFESIQMNNYLEEFQIDDEKKLTTLSYGQKKKFLIAFGLATNARLLIMDEPTNGLDIPSKSQFRKIIASSATEERCILISTHQVRDLGNIIDQVTILDKGKIIFNQNLESISQKFVFGRIKDESDDNVIYSEDIMGGKAAICLNNGKDSEVDLELLFNAVINSTEKINNEFKK
ncbi:MAG: ABC transporter ATP-binding protein [Bacteroidetes bacterium]|nr:ABC transporter ATP-binding protein [Bacteroidota bacterium]